MSLLDPQIWNNKIFKGHWINSPKIHTVTEVATDQCLGHIGLAQINDVQDAAHIAKHNQVDWAKQSYLERGAIFENAVKIAEQHREEIIDWIMRESGSLHAKASFETQLAIQVLKHCMQLPSQDQGQILPAQHGKISLAKRVPLGVVGVISPFNFPLYLALRAVAPALALGNAVVLKPDERTAVCSGYVIARIFELAGLAPGLLHVLPGAGDIGEALTLNPDIASIQFTGSTPVGRIIAANAGKTLKKVSLELGGKNSLIILDDADLDLAIKNIAWGVFLHAGQICMSSGKVLIHRSVYQQVKTRLIEKVQSFKVGNPTDDGVHIGPLIDTKQSQRVIKLIQQAIDAGAVLETGGHANGVFVEASVLSNVNSDNPIFAEEIFGPVAVLVPYDNEEQLIELANAGDYGLSAGIITNNIGRGLAIAQQLKVGLLHINDQTVNDDVINPFGGFGASGNATRIGGPANIDEFTQWQWMTIQNQAPAYPL